jgi:hypothetical protein
MTALEEPSSLKLLSQHFLEDISVSLFINLNSIKFEYTSSSEIDHDSYFLEQNSFLESFGLLERFVTLQGKDS